MRRKSPIPALMLFTTFTSMFMAVMAANLSIKWRNDQIRVQQQAQLQAIQAIQQQRQMQAIQQAQQLQRTNHSPTQIRNRVFHAAILTPLPIMRWESLG